MDKVELGALSDAEKGLVAQHRQKMASMERTQIQLRDEMDRILNVDRTNETVEYLYDFANEWQSNGNNIVRIVEATAGRAEIIPGPINDAGGNKIGEIKAIKPIDVFKELETFAGADMDTKDIDAKVMVLNAKKGLIRNNNYARKEMIDMVTRLENRKKWPEFKDFYEQFTNTTSEKVMDLVGKYKLVLKGSDLFVAKFPDDAVNIMTEYTEQTKKLCGKAPVFYVIAEESMFKAEYQKKDPILLVQSPFGAYWQILGAWDKEMILLDEL